MKQYICGVDIGNKGASTILENGKYYDHICFNDSNGNLKKQEVRNFLLRHRKLDMHVYIEDVRSIHLSSAKSNFTFGGNKHFIEGIVMAYKLPYTFVHSKVWQKLAWQGVRPIKKKVKGKDKTDTKATSLIACNRLFPDANLLRTPACSTPHDGLVDSYLIAYYGSAWYKDGE